MLLKDSPIGTISVDENALTIPAGGKLEANQVVDVIYAKQTHKAVIQSIKDCSIYTVVFNDGDEKILKRSQVGHS